MYVGTHLNQWCFDVAPFLSGFIGAVNATADEPLAWIDLYYCSFLAGASITIVVYASLHSLHPHSKHLWQGRLRQRNLSGFTKNSGQLMFLTVEMPTTLSRSSRRLRSMFSLSRICSRETWTLELLFNGRHNSVIDEGQEGSLGCSIWVLEKPSCVEGYLANRGLPYAYVLRYSSQCHSVLTPNDEILYRSIPPEISSPLCILNFHWPWELPSILQSPSHILHRKAISHFPPSNHFNHLHTPQAFDRTFIR